MIEVSLNEVETLSAKAARGAGFPWGLADEVGRGARKLAEAGAPWTEALLGLRADWEQPILRTPGRAAEVAASPSSRNAPLCPIRTGTWLADLDCLCHLEQLAIHDLAAPIWLAAMLEAPNGSEPLRIQWSGAAAVVAGSDLTFSGDQILAVRVDVTMRRGVAWGSSAVAQTRSFISSTALREIEALAARTYVPATAASRSRGAGGSRTDDE